MYAHKKLLENRVYKHFKTGRFSLNIPFDYIQLLAISDSFIDFYLISPKVSFTLVSTTNLNFPIIDSCIFHSEKDLVAISIEAINYQIELLLLEFDELIEKFQTKSKFSFEEINKKKSPVDYQGLKIYATKQKIFALGYQNYIGILNYNENFNQICYEKEIYLAGFYGDVTFDENNKYIFVVCNIEDSNRVIDKTLIRIELEKYKITEAKICIAESTKEIIVKNTWVNPETFIYITSKSGKLEIIDFSKKNDKKNKKDIFLVDPEKSLITNFQTFEEFLLIGFDDGKIIIYNKYKMQLSGNHIYHFPEISDVLYYQMIFLNQELFCLICSTTEMSVYNLDYQKKDGELTIKEEFEKNAIITYTLLNSVIDSTLLKEEETSRIFCLLTKNRLNSNLNKTFYLKKIEYGLKPFHLLNFELEFEGFDYEEFHDFWIFENNQDLLLFFSIHGKIKSFQKMENQSKFQEICFKEIFNDKNDEIQDVNEIFQFNEHIICFIQNQSIRFIKTSENFTINSIILNENIKSSIILFKKLIENEQIYFVFLLEDKRLVFYEFRHENNKIVSYGIHEKILDNHQIENLFIYHKEKFFIIISYYNSENEIIEFNFEQHKFCDIITLYFPEISIFSYESLLIDSNLISFISSYSGELFIVNESSQNSDKLIKKWAFNSDFAYKLKKRNNNSLYFFSVFETYIIENYTQDDAECIRCIKVLFDIEKQPTNLVYNYTNETEIAIKGREIRFYTLKSDFKKKLTADVYDTVITFERQPIKEKKQLISKGSPLKTNKNTIQSNDFKKLKRINYSEINKLLLMISEDLWLVLYNPFMYRFIGSFDLKNYFQKKLFSQFSMDMFKLIKFPNNSELLCISSTFLIQDEEKDEEKEESYLNFCEIISKSSLSLNDFNYEIKFFSEELIKKFEDQILDIIFLFDLNVFVLCIGCVIEIYSYEMKTADTLDFSFNLVLQHKIGKKLICLDVTDKNLILVGDSTKSLYVFRLEKTLNANDKFVYKLNLIRSEKEQRLLSIGRVIDNESIIGIDKYGECFISQLNNDNYIDSNNNSINYALISLRDSSRNIHFLNINFNHARQISLINKSHEKTNENNDSQYIILTTLMGGLHQIKSFNLIYLFDNNEINEYIEGFSKFLKEHKSLKQSCNKNNLMNFVSAVKPSKKFIDYDIINEFLQENKILQEKMISLYVFPKENSSKLAEFTFDEIIFALKELKKLF